MLYDDWVNPRISNKLAAPEHAQQRGLSRVSVDLIKWRVLGVVPPDPRYRAYLEYRESITGIPLMGNSVEQLKAAILGG